jgi:hypothetical protein
LFKIRREQKLAFRQEALRDFEQWMVRHVERCLPDPWTALGETRVREVILLGIERAAAHDIYAEREVCKFIDLMLVFGIDFDQRCPWAKEILKAPTSLDSFARMTLLHERALDEA